jgi:hypothetical protein
LHAANPVFVEKKNGTIRVCADYRPINKVMDDFEWPMPRIQDIRHWVRGYTWFTRFDQTNAFHRIKVPPAYRDATALWTPKGTYRFTVMEYGLKTAPAIFQRFMDHVLAREPDALPYSDDTLLRAHNREELKTLQRRVRQKMTARGIHINEDKSQEEVQEIDFCGLRITPEGLEPPRAISEIQNIPCPYTKKDRQSALGYVNYFRDYVTDLHHITPLLYPDQSNIARSDDYERDWEELKRRMNQHTTLAHFQDDKPAQLLTDASKHGIGGLILQNQRIIATFAKTLTPSQARYSTTDREHLALVESAKHFKAFLHRPIGQTEIKTDHTALLNRREGLTPRQERWRYEVITRIRNLTYIAGAENPADFLSRKGWGLGARKSIRSQTSPLPTP